MGAARGAPEVERLLAEAGWMEALAARLLGGGGEAEDVVQDTLVAALESGGAVLEARGPAGLRAWLAAVVRNLALRRRGREGARRHHERAAARDEATTCGDGLERVELQRRLAEALLALEEPYRSAVVLRHFEGLGAAQIAARQGVSEAAARQRVARGLAALRARLGVREGGRAFGLAALVAWWTRKPWTSGLTTAGGALMGAKGTAAGVALLGAVALVVWTSVREGSSAPAEAEAPSSAVLGALERVPDADAKGPALAQEVPAAAPSEERERADAAARSVARMELRVVDAEHRPVEGARVSRIDGVGDGRPLVTGADGVARLSLASGEEGLRNLDVRVEGDGYLPAVRTLEARGLQELVLRAWPVVRGTLLTPDGLPPARGRVRVGVLPEGGGDVVIASCETGPDGGFRVGGLPVGQLRWLAGEAEGGVEARRDLTISLNPDSVREVDLTLSPGLVVEGVVLDAQTGEPLPGAFVWSGDFFWDESDLSPTAVADVDGRFRLEDVRLVGGESPSRGRGHVVLAVYARTEHHAPNEGFVLRPWRDDGRYEVELRLDRAGCALEGVLRLPDSEEAAADTLLIALNARGELRFGRTDGEGRFAFETQPPGTFELFALRGPLEDGAAAALTVELAVGERRSVDLALARGAGSRIAGRLVDAGGAPLAGRRVGCGLIFRSGALSTGAFHRSEATTDAEGRYAFDDLPAAVYELAPVAADGEVAEPPLREVRIARDERRDAVDFALGAAATFAGRLERAAGEIETTRVVLSDARTGAERETVFADAAGRFLFRPVPAGRYLVRALRDGAEPIEVAVGPEGDLDIALFLP